MPNHISYVRSGNRGASVRGAACPRVVTGTGGANGATVTGGELRALRGKLGHSQKSLSRCLGISERTMLRLEARAKVPIMVTLAMRSVPSLFQVRKKKGEIQDES